MKYKNYFAIIFLFFVFFIFYNCKVDSYLNYNEYPPLLEKMTNQHHLGGHVRPIPVCMVKGSTFLYDYYKGKILYGIKGNIYIYDLNENKNMFLFKNNPLLDAKILNDEHLIFFQYGGDYYKYEINSKQNILLFSKNLVSSQFCIDHKNQTLYFHNFHFYFKYLPLIETYSLKSGLISETNMIGLNPVMISEDEFYYFSFPERIRLYHIYKNNYRIIKYHSKNNYYIRKVFYWLKLSHDRKSLMWFETDQGNRKNLRKIGIYDLQTEKISYIKYKNIFFEDILPLSDTKTIVLVKEEDIYCLYYWDYKSKEKEKIVEVKLIESEDDEND